MKTLKVAMIATLITVLLIIFCGIALADEYNTITTMVIDCEEIEDNLWVISCIAKDGNIWEFFEDVEPWDVGDIAVLVMFNDEIIDAVYTEHLDIFDTLRWLP